MNLKVLVIPQKDILLGRVDVSFVDVGFYCVVFAVVFVDIVVFKGIKPGCLN